MPASGKFTLILSWISVSIKSMTEYCSAQWSSVKHWDACNMAWNTGYH